MDELDRYLRDQAEALVWAHATDNPAFQAEVADLEQAYSPADRETWPA